MMENPDREFVLGMISSTGLSATQIALKAGLAPSTLTRIQYNRTDHRLSAPTLDKLREQFPEAFGPYGHAALSPFRPDGDFLDLSKLRPADRLAMMTLYNSLTEGR